MGFVSLNSRKLDFAMTLRFDEHCWQNSIFSVLSKLGRFPLHHKTLCHSIIEHGWPIWKKRLSTKIYIYLCGVIIWAFFYYFTCKIGSSRQSFVCILDSRYKSLVFYNYIFIVSFYLVFWFFRHTNYIHKRRRFL